MLRSQNGISLRHGQPISQSLVDGKAMHGAIIRKLRNLFPFEDELRPAQINFSGIRMKFI
jgi:hypothetical protein